MLVIFTARSVEVHPNLNRAAGRARGDPFGRTLGLGLKFANPLGESGEAVGSAGYALVQVMAGPLMWRVS